ncbi:MAG: outer membrane beta-barrel protein [Bacteroidetes bacterium]|nr:outer membrane beta-barrel protein [Bacteroidota bacterium]MBX7046303.1 porin family protein [Ignavibacteria bacterium]
MKSKLLLLAVLIFTFCNLSQAQNYIGELKLTENKSKLNPPVPGSPVSLGVHIGVASIESETGFNVGAFAEIGYGKFAFTPQLNYWKLKNTNNFEIAGLGRIKLAPPTGAPINPYLDGGLSINFYNDATQSNNTRLGIVLGGGVESQMLSAGFSVYGDIKYKLIIIKESNTSGFVINVGLKFPM